MIMKWSFTREERVQRHLLVQANVILEHLRVSDGGSQDSTVTIQRYAPHRSCNISKAVVGRERVSTTEKQSMKRIRKIT